MYENQLSVAMPSDVDMALQNHLIRRDLEEDLAFGLWTQSRGKDRLTALLHTAVFPEAGDRQRHGNVSFNPEYFERVCEIAVKEGCGIAFLHSHPGPGWQNMSKDDIIAELKMAATVEALTDLPLIGMTVGCDGTWSARGWRYDERRGQPVRQWADSVRVVGDRLKVDFLPGPPPEFGEKFKHTATVWGEKNHAILATLRIGIVGVGSVGSVVAEALARMGLKYVTPIDFDEVQEHNLDRLVIATEDDLGKLKVNVASDRMMKVATSSGVVITPVPYSVVEEEGYRAALDCDVLFSCVDRPRARHILNHFAYRHLIPVIDGGVQVRFNGKEFAGADWQLQTVAPGRPCLQCLGTYEPVDVDTEAAGMLDDPSYLAGLPSDHKYKRNENVFPFGTNLATLEVLQMVALVTGIAGITDFGIQRFRYMPGNLECDAERSCHSGCEFVNLIAQGDRHFELHGYDHAAEKARKRQKESKLTQG